MVDRILLPGATGPEVDGGAADPEPVQRDDVARRGRCDGSHDGRPRQAGLVGIASLRGDPALVHGEGLAGRDGGLGAASSLLLVEVEVRHGQQAPGRAEHELGEVGRALGAQRRERLADLEGIPDRATEGLVHRRQLADDASAGAPPEVEHGLGEQLVPARGSS